MQFYYDLVEILYLIAYYDAPELVDERIGDTWRIYRNHPNFNEIRARNTLAVVNAVGITPKKERKTPLQFAVERNRPKTAELLMRYGASPKSIDRTQLTKEMGQRLLRVAVERNDIEAVKLLLSYGVKPLFDKDIKMTKEMNVVLYTPTNARGLAEVVAASQHSHMGGPGRELPPGIEDTIAQHLGLPATKPDAARETRRRAAAKVVRETTNARQESEALAAMKTGGRSRKTRRRSTRRRR